MFEWNVEEGRFMREHISKNKSFLDCELETSREDKIAFADKQTGGKISYVLDLAQRFEADKEKLPKDQYGDVRTVSLKAWLKKNDTKEMCDISYKYGKINMGISGLGERFIQNLDRQGAWDTWESFVDEVFHRLLLKCRDAEISYYNSHDEYSVAMAKIEKGFLNGNYFTFDLPLVSSSSHGLYLASPSREERRRLTLDELNQIIEMNEQVNEFVALLSKQIGFTYDEPLGELPDERDIIR